MSGSVNTATRPPRLLMRGHILPVCPSCPPGAIQSRAIAEKAPVVRRGRRQGRLDFLTDALGRKRRASLVMRAGSRPEPPKRQVRSKPHERLHQSTQPAVELDFTIQGDDTKAWLVGHDPGLVQSVAVGFFQIADVVSLVADGVCAG